MTTESTVTIGRELLAEVLAIGSRGIDPRSTRATHMSNSHDRKASFEGIYQDCEKMFQARRILQGEQEPTFDPDEQQTGEVRHRTDITA